MSAIAAQKIVGGINQCPRSRAKIENALGIAAWSDADEFRERQEQAQFFGCDLATLTADELRAVCRKHRVHHAHLPRPALIENLLVHFASRTQPAPSSANHENAET